LPIAKSGKAVLAARVPVVVEIKALRFMPKLMNEDRMRKAESPALDALAISEPGLI
jgi:hypothetical protein